MHFRDLWNKGATLVNRENVLTKPDYARICSEHLQPEYPRITQKKCSMVCTFTCDNFSAIGIQIFGRDQPASHNEPVWLE